MGKLPEKINWFKEKNEIINRSFIEIMTEEQINNLYNRVYFSEIEEMFILQFLEKNPEMIDWGSINANRHPEAIKLLEKNFEKINWILLSFNPSAVNLLEIHQEKIDWMGLLINAAIFELDYSAIKERTFVFKEELIQKVNHPSKIQKLLDMGYNIDEIIFFCN